ncbi:hypothetical protein bas24_0092 [Escherichia phage SeppeHuegi]|nr:hypothetical protein bas24_0092 [Escherichia phage SeppeHuegi]
MTTFSHLIPPAYHSKVVDHGTHVVIGGEIFITDNEEIAIAIIDSTQHDFMVILQHEPDNFTFYSSYGVDKGGKGLVGWYISEWFDG